MRAYSRTSSMRSSSRRVRSGSLPGSGAESRKGSLPKDWQKTLLADDVRSEATTMTPRSKSSKQSRMASKLSSGTERSVTRAFFDDNDGKKTTTFRHGLMGNHYEVDLQLVDSSASIPSAGAAGAAHWSSAGTSTTHWTTYDMLEPVHLTEVNIKFGSTAPQVVSVSASHKSYKGPFTSIKRSGVKDNKLHIAWRAEEAYRYWKIEYASLSAQPTDEANEANEAQTPATAATPLVVEDIQLIAEDHQSRKPCHGLRQLSKSTSRRLGDIGRAFSEKDVLTEEQLNVRHIARKLSVPLDIAEGLMQKFKKYDVDGSGHIDHIEFRRILQDVFDAQGDHDIPPERFQHYWREVDLDHNGLIDFEEFIHWFHSTLRGGSLNPQEFYTALGSRRLQFINA